MELESELAMLKDTNDRLQKEIDHLKSEIQKFKDLNDTLVKV